MATLKLGFNPKTWDTIKPTEIKGVKLSAALKAADKALGAEKKADLQSIEACLKAVEAAGQAARDSIKKECSAKKHKDLVKALQRFESDCKAELKRLADAKKKAEGDDNEDGDVSDEELLGIKLFKDCIKKARLKSSAEDGVSFCLGVHKIPENCKLVFLKKKKFAKQTFKRLYGLSKKNKELGLQRPKMTYGAAYRDRTEKDTLVLHIVDGAPTEIPGMVRKLEKWRKTYKQELLPFKKLSLRSPAGKPLESTPDPDESSRRSGNRSTR